MMHDYQHGFCERVGRVAFLCAVLAAGIYRGDAARSETNSALPADDLFKEGQIPQIRILLSPAAMDQLGQRPRTYVTCTIREGNITYTNVSIRLKGGPGSFRSLDDKRDKPAFTVNFDRLAPGQKFHGLKKLHLNNSVQDQSYLSEKISRELFEAAGVPTPRAAHVVVELNRRERGLYVLVEGIDKQFLRRYFKDTSGNVYDGHSGNDVMARQMRTNSGENPQDQSRLRALGAAAQEPDLEARWRRLQQTLDVDRFISFLAMEMITAHWDGYALNRNNFRIYHDRTTDRMVFLPQGVDQAFQRLNIPVVPPPRMQGLIAWSLLEIPQARERYRERVVQLLTNVLQVSVLTNHLFEVASKVHAALAESDPQMAAGYLQRAVSLARRIQTRVNALERQLLSQNVVALKFDQGRVFSLSNWAPQIDLGTPRLTQEPSPEGQALLYIRARDTEAGSWRARVLLGRGQYRFEGKVRFQGVKLNAEDQRSGVGLRISRQKFSRKLSGDMEWTTMPFDFEVQEDQTEVELVCELRATQGQAWFDLASLRLIRRE